MKNVVFSSAFLLSCLTVFASEHKSLAHKKKQTATQEAAVIELLRARTEAKRTTSVPPKMTGAQRRAANKEKKQQLEAQRLAALTNPQDLSELLEDTPADNIMSHVAPVAQHPVASADTGISDGKPNQPTDQTLSEQVTLGWYDWATSFFTRS